jgi:uncharacterized protein (UPF0335 family)
MNTSLEHDDEAITARMRGYIAEIKQLDAEGAAIDRRRRDVYREAAEYGFNAGILKKIARQKQDGEAAAEANEQIEYLRLIGGEKATEQMRKGKTFSEAAFGSCEFPSDFADAIGGTDNPFDPGMADG